MVHLCGSFLSYFWFFRSVVRLEEEILRCHAFCLVTALHQTRRSTVCRPHTTPRVNRTELGALESERTTFLGDVTIDLAVQTRA